MNPPNPRDLGITCIVARQHTGLLADPLRKLTEKLRRLLSSSPDLYGEGAGLMSDDMLGVPIRCRLRKLGKGGKELQCEPDDRNL